MDELTMITLMREALWTGIIVATPILGVALALSFNLPILPLVLISALVMASAVSALTGRGYAMDTVLDRTGVRSWKTRAPILIQTYNVEPSVTVSTQRCGGSKMASQFILHALETSGVDRMLRLNKDGKHSMEEALTIVSGLFEVLDEYYSSAKSTF